VPEGRSKRKHKPAGVVVAPAGPLSGPLTARR